MRLLTDNGKSRVPFEFHDNRVTLKVTRYTTFHDVVHMLTHKAGITNSSARLYAVFECMTDLERKIDGGVRVLNTWRSWGCKASNFRFVVKLPDSKILLNDYRSCDNTLILKDLHRYSTAKSEEIANLLPQSYTEEIAHTWIRDTTDSNATIIHKSKQFKNDQVYKSTITNNRNMSLAKIASKLNSTTSGSVGILRETDCRHTQRNNDSLGKRALLVKYLKDLKLFSKRKSKKTSQTLGKRERANAAEFLEDHSGRCLERMDDPDVPARSYLDSSHITIANCRYHWDTYYHFDNDSNILEDIIDSAEESDHDSDLSNTSSLARKIRALDTAFVQSSRYPESDEGIDVTSITSGDLNTAFVAECERQYATDEEYSEHFYMVDEFEKKMYTPEYTRNIVSARSISSQDNAVDSFMRSRLESF